ncbi:MULTISPECIES: hypothetical protein [unclassified Thioalkalivibrio]|uniref:hypothetical protein n=1 Tax=unclassified Thioalkalivibrio TaxID=2621013 RepID=UPI00037F225D|nr:MULTISPECIES: hypothetical protein [unclassified Thioalkalivibrio]
MEAPLTNPAPPTVPATRPSGSDRLGLGQLSAPSEFDRPLNDPEAGAARRPIEDRAEQQRNRNGDEGDPRADLVLPRNEREMAGQARLAAEIEAFQSGTADDARPGEERIADGGALEDSGVEALRRRVELAFSFAGPAEEPRRELNIVV